MKKYLTAKETINRLVFIQRAWSRGPYTDARKANLVMRLNHSCTDKALLEFMAKIVWRGDEYNN